VLSGELPWESCVKCAVELLGCPVALLEDQGRFDRLKRRGLGLCNDVARVCSRLCGCALRRPSSPDQ